jgi:hypothetical protein
MKSFKTPIGALLLVALMAVTVPAHALSCLLFPLGCLVPKHKYGEEQEATVLNISRHTIEYVQISGYTDPYSSMQNSQTWYVWFRSGNTLYQAYHYETIVGMVTGYHPKRPEWIGKTIKMRFSDRKVLGTITVLAELMRPDGKYWDLIVTSIVGPDGVDECKHGLKEFCPPQAKVDRAAREAEQLEKIKKTGAKSAVEVAPGPAEEAVPPPTATEPAATAPVSPPPVEAAPAPPAAVPPVAVPAAAPVPTT